MKKASRAKIIAVAAIPALAVVAGLVAAGVTVNWGPLAFLHNWEGEVSAIEDRYDTDRDGEIVFYGASNFAQWTQLDDDLGEYPVQNHAFGGSTDRDLLQFADRLLYPYEPTIIVLQTGSNDYVGMTGTDQERIDAVIDQKRSMLEAFHDQLPDAQIVVMSGILMPGRAEFTPVIRGINDRIADLADELDYVTFVDAEALTWDGESYDESMFVPDGIHLTHDARLRWADEYILPALDAVRINRPRTHTTTRTETPPTDIARRRMTRAEPDQPRALRQTQGARASPGRNQVHRGDGLRSDQAREAGNSLNDRTKPGRRRPGSETNQAQRKGHKFGIRKRTPLPRDMLHVREFRLRKLGRCYSPRAMRGASSS